MENCLITKLKGTVNNDSLLKIGELRLNIKLSAALNNQYYNRLIITPPSGTDTFTVKVSGGHNMWSYNSSNMQANVNWGSEKTFTGGFTICFPETGEYSVSVMSKYSIKLVEIPFTATNPAIDVTTFNYSPLTSIKAQNARAIASLAGDFNDFIEHTKSSLGVISAEYQNIYLDVANLTKLTQLTGAAFPNCKNVTGNVAELGKLSINVNVQGTGVSGNIEDFVKSKVNIANIATGTCPAVNFNNTSVKYKGTPVSIVGSGNIAWEPYGNNQTKITAYGSETIIDN